MGRLSRHVFGDPPPPKNIKKKKSGAIAGNEDIARFVTHETHHSFVAFSRSHGTSQHRRTMCVCRYLALPEAGHERDMRVVWSGWLLWAAHQGRLLPRLITVAWRYQSGFLWISWEIICVRVLGCVSSTSLRFPGGMATFLPLPLFYLTFKAHVSHKHVERWLFRVVGDPEWRGLRY